MTKKTYFTASEAMEILGVSRPTLYKMLADGRLEGALIGGKWKIDPLSIPAFLRRGIKLPLDKQNKKV